MMIEVEAPDGTIVEFPEGTPREVMRDAMRRRFPQTQSQQPDRVSDLRRQIEALGPPMANRGAVRPSEEAAMLAAEGERTRLQGELQLQEGNIKIGEAPLEARFKSGLGINRLSGYQRMLGPDFDVKEVETEGPYKGEIIFRRKGEDQWTTVRDPEGMFKPADLAARGRDIASITPTGAAEAVGAIGGAAGSLLPQLRGPSLLARMIPGPIMGAFLGGTAARTGAERVRLGYGQEAGVVAPDESIAAEALKLGIMQGVFDAGAVAVYKTVRALAGRGVAPQLEGITQAMIDDGMRRLRARLGPEEAKLATIGDVLAEMGRTNEAALYKSIEEKVARDATKPLQEDFARRVAAKEEAAAGRLAGALPEGVTRPEQNVVGIGRRVEEAAPGVESFQAEAAGVGGPVEMARRDLALEIRERVKAAEVAAKAPIRRAYTAMENVASGTPEIAQTAAAKISDLEADLKSRILPSLSDDNRKLVNEALGSLYTTTTDAAGNEVRELKPLNYTQYQKAISDLRTAIRESYRGEWKGETQQLLDLEKAFVDDRNRLLQAVGGDDAIKRIKALDAEWRKVTDRFRRADLAEAFRVKSVEAEELTAEKFMERVILDRDKAEALAPLLSDRERTQMRARLTADLSDLAMVYGRKTEREINQAVIERTIRQADSPYPVFFTPAELRQLASGARLQQVRRIVGVADRENFGSWFDDFYSAKNIDQAQALFRRVDKTDPALGDAIRGMVRQRLYDDLSKAPTQGGKPVLDVDKLTELLRDPRSTQWMASSLGPDFAARMKTVAEATNAILPGGPRLQLGASAQNEPTTLGMIRRAGRAALGPLSRESRFLTYALENANAEVRERIGRAILDPEYFGKIVNSARSVPGERATAATIGTLLSEGGGIADNDSEDWVSTLPQRVNQIKTSMGAER